MTTERRWFSVIVVFESRVAGIIGVRPLCEERIVLFVAEDEPTAIAAARRYGVSAQHSYDNSARETVQWIFVGVSDANELEERDATIGWEVGSRFVRKHRRTVDRLSESS
ncbi:MAG TPA: DUF4288 domain-containing protein [Gemmatimonadales bacterium]|jgi:hypothetical protein